MSGSISPIVKTEAVRELPEAVPLNEAAWQAWLQKGRIREERNYGRRVKAAGVLSLVGVGAAACAGFFSAVASYDIPIRFLVATGAVGLMVHALTLRRYTFAAAFGALALLYNPVAPLLDFSSAWQRAFIAASGLPFVAALMPQPKLAANA